MSSEFISNIVEPSTPPSETNCQQSLSIKRQASLTSKPPRPPPPRPFSRSNTISLPIGSIPVSVNSVLKTKEDVTYQKNPPVSMKHVFSTSECDSNQVTSDRNDERVNEIVPNNSTIQPLNLQTPEMSEVTSKTETIQLSNTTVKSSDEEDKVTSTPESLSETEIQKKVQNRPPPPTSKPPVRPPRPFAPPTEAKLAKKRPPPIPVTVIDTRPKTRNSSTSSSPGVSSVTSNDVTNAIPEDIEIHTSSLPRSLPQRPPLPNVKAKSTPTFSPVVVEVETEHQTVETSDNIPPVNKDSSDDQSPHRLSIDGISKREVVEENVNDLQPTSSPKSGSPNEGRKLVSKMKSSFRSLTQRRHKSRSTEDNVRNSGPWRRVASTDNYNGTSKNQYDKERYPDKLPEGVISPIVVQCIAYLNREHILKEPGLFRIPGDLSVMKKYRVEFARGEDVDLTECLDPHTIAGLLKFHFREQRRSIIPGEALVQQIAFAVQNKDVDEFKRLLESIEPTSLAAIRMLAELLKKITEYSEINHMSSGILATSCGPSFFPRLPPSNANAVIKFLTDFCDELF